MSRKSVGKWSVLWFLALVIALYAGVFALTDFNSSPLKEKLLELPWTLQVHALGGAIALLLGLLQLSRVKAGVPGKWHKLVGRAYALAVLSSGAMGLYMAIRADGGLVAKLGFGLLAVVWLASLLAALLAIYRKQIARHRFYMWVNYALTWASVTLRVELPLLVIAFGFETGYQIIAWLCWVPNLIFAFWWLQRSGQR